MLLLLLLLCVCRPYTTSDNMQYQPLEDLLKKMGEAPVVPDVLVLMGPFVSVNHPVVKTGHIVDDEGNEARALCMLLLLALVVVTMGGLVGGCGTG